MSRRWVALVLLASFGVASTVPQAAASERTTSVVAGSRLAAPAVVASSTGATVRHRATDLVAEPAPDRVFVAWNDNGDPGPFGIQLSYDDGETWEPIGSIDRPPVELPADYYGERALVRIETGPGLVSEAIPVVACGYDAAGTVYTAWENPCWAHADHDGHPYEDVLKSWQHDPISFLHANEITNGRTPYEFAPEDPVTRGETAAFLWRLAGRPSGAPAHGFTDVRRSWQQEPVSWLAAHGITTGTSATTFSPDDPVTRGQMAAFLWRLVDRPYGHPAHPFRDVTKRWQEAPVRWLADLEITQGVTATRFAPDDHVTRGQMAAFIHRTAEHTFRATVFWGTGSGFYEVYTPVPGTAAVVTVHRYGTGRLELYEEIHVPGEPMPSRLVGDGEGDLRHRIGVNLGRAPALDGVTHVYVSDHTDPEGGPDGATEFVMVIVEPLQTLRAVPSSGSLSGTGDELLVVTDAPWSAVLEHRGPGEVAVDLYDRTGVSERWRSGSGDTTLHVDVWPEAELLRLHADGSWTLSR